MKLFLFARVLIAKTPEHELTEKLVRFLKSYGIKFRVFESGTKSVYVTFTLKESEYKVRISNHQVPKSNHPRTQQIQKERIVDFDLYPGSHKTLQDVFHFIQTIKEGAR